LRQQAVREKMPYLFYFALVFACNYNFHKLFFPLGAPGTIFLRQVLLRELHFP
jgi:hypothetical protein